MPENLRNSALTNQFFREKSILPSHNFYVTFDYDLSSNSDDIKYYHIKSINVPFYRFRGEQIKIGHLSYTLPVLDHDGFEFNLVFEEDRNGRIFELINNLQSRIVDQNGFFRAYNTRNIERFYVLVTDQGGNQVMKIHFYNVFLLSVQDLTFDYSMSEAMKYDCTFKADWIEVEMYDQQEVKESSAMMPPSDNFGIA